MLPEAGCRAGAAVGVAVWVGEGGGDAVGDGVKLGAGVVVGTGVVVGKGVAVGVVRVGLGGIWMVAGGSAAIWLLFCRHRRKDATTRIKSAAATIGSQTGIRCVGGGGGMGSTRPQFPQNAAFV